MSLAAPPLAATAARLRSLTLRDFRNYPHTDVEFPRAGVVLIGDNGAGKTNLLEAIAYLGVLRSFRHARDRDMIRHDAPAFHLRGALGASGDRTIGVGFERSTGRKKIVLDGLDMPRQVDALGVFASVAWSPSDVALVTGGPAERRRYLDIMLSVTSRRYVEALRGYRAALDRRNAAIRDAARASGSARESAVAVWEPALARHGAVLHDARCAWVGVYAAEFARLGALLGEQAPLALQYAHDTMPHAQAVEALRERLQQERARDMQRGATCIGPHRDDIFITLAGRDARTFGSAGQQRTAAIALRLLEARTVRAALPDGADYPTLLLDDPFAELDPERAACTLRLLATEDLGQVMLAVPRESEIPAEFRHLTAWRVRNGTIAT
jgi:DNA replication and repair protein RecF